MTFGVVCAPLGGLTTEETGVPTESGLHEGESVSVLCPVSLGGLFARMVTFRLGV
jgi:hypothetical protein